MYKSRIVPADHHGSQKMHYEINFYVYIQNLLFSLWCETVEIHKNYSLLLHYYSDH